MSRGPGFIDVSQNEPAEPELTPSAPPETPSEVGRPMLLDAESGEARGRIDPLWEPEAIQMPKSGPSSLGWLPAWRSCC